MRGLLVADDVEIDFCTSHGFWFDGGELSKSLSNVDEDAELDPPKRTVESPPRAPRMLARLAEQYGEMTVCDVCFADANGKCAMCSVKVCTLHLIGDNCAACHLDGTAGLPPRELELTRGTMSESKRKTVLTTAAILAGLGLLVGTSAVMGTGGVLGLLALGGLLVGVWATEKKR
jgi:Zn-finger nucleic acid-binding protein